MDLNLSVICGRLAIHPEVRTFDSGTQMGRLLVTTRVDSPRRRVDVIPVTYWPQDPAELDDWTDHGRGTRVWVCGAIQRRFWESADGRRSRTELVAQQIRFVPEETTR